MANLRAFTVLAAAAALLLGALPCASAQNSVQLFGSTFVRPSTTGTAQATPANFNSATVNLTCVSGTPIKAVLSSTADGTGNVLVDNYIQVSVTTSNTPSTPVNVCKGGTSEPGQGGTQFNCFNTTYEGAAAGMVGADMNSYVGTGGVPAIDISSLFLEGTQQATIGLVDTGFDLANASLYLVTSCAQGGVTGPATITGNPISGTKPPSTQLSQDFTFNPTPGQGVGFTYDLTTSQQNGTLQISNSTIPSTNDSPLDPALWQNQYATGTSFATSSCIVHRGELLNGQSACKMYTLTCQVGSGATAAGALCPVSQLRDEVFQDEFTGPKFTLPDITGPNGKTYHQGVGLLMASEGWTGGPCGFSVASGLQMNDCPQNLLTYFSSPGSTSAQPSLVKPALKNGIHALAQFDDDDDFDSDGTGTHPNSLFVSVAQVPEDLTTVSVLGQHPGGWVNNRNIKVGLLSEPPVLPSTVANYQYFVASPIQSITYGIAPASAVLSTKFGVPGDVTLTNSAGCPSPATPGQPLAKTFAPPSQMVPVAADGQYLLHYFAQDCAGTEELKFTAGATGGWSTSFYSVPINVDTVAPVVATAPMFSPAPGTVKGTVNSYLLNQHVTVTFSCTDDASGVATCGAKTYGAPGTLNTGALTFVLDTSSVGKKTFTVQTTDAAGNTGTPVSVTYNVVAAAADMAILVTGPANVSTGDTLSYHLLALNLGPNQAQNVVIKDLLPPGTTFVSAGYEDVSCFLYGWCNPAPQAGSCSYNAGIVTCNAGDLNALTLVSQKWIAVNIVVKVTASPKATLLDIATVQSDNSDPNQGDNSSQVQTAVRK